MIPERPCRGCRNCRRSTSRSSQSRWRKSQMRLRGALAIASLAALLVSGPALAQTGTPETDTTENPRLVDPSECTNQPRPADQISQILDLQGQGVPAPN